MKIPKESIAKQVFGSSLKRKLLEFLFSNQMPVSERELARIIGKSNVAVNKAMKQLLDFNIVKANSIGTAMIWSINESSFAYPYVKAFIEAGKISPFEYLKKAIREEIDILNRETVKYRNKEKSERPSIKDAYLFGSIVDQTATPESDIDVLIVLESNYKNERLKQQLIHTIGMKILEKTGNKISFHVYSAESVEKNEPFWLLHAIRNGERV